VVASEWGGADVVVRVTERRCVDSNDYGGYAIYYAVAGGRRRAAHA
jgi:hypothetical protein